ncbi:DUF4007 family protein [Domibacillus sp. PGB-M46]|uniref:DUF4007 family protein n=1 Tax=Domibacillus sp. PGB-M46 TaxID=2910255 RepID=UPI001F56D195|nr:DUF4007 family protein [Domibacillus sp. PGB-M46]MCI2254776.1 DUF4007 family protein [Domibacillus sp. PGB-M46]
MSKEELVTYHLNFHQSFAPEIEAISRIVSLADSDAGFLTKEEISEKTMIPTGKSSGKVEPHIYYAAAMKLITFEKADRKYECKLTRLGKLVVLEDPYLVENISKLLLHVFLADKHSAAMLWSYLFNEFIPKVMPDFNDELIQNAIERHFSSNVNLTPFRTCYSSDLSLGDLGLIRLKDKGYKIEPHRISRENVYVYGYVLLEKWEQILADRSEITFDEITDVLYFGKPFLWGERQLRDALDLMQDAGLIKVNAQLSPITIIKNQNSSFCLDNMYSLLI